MRSAVSGSGDTGIVTPLASGSATSAPAGNGRAQRARRPRFALAKFRPTSLPTTLLTRPSLLARLEAGAAQRLTVVVGSAGAGKSVLLSSWAATRQAKVTSWLSCDEADADPVRFWAAFIQAPQAVAPGFGADAAELLVLDGVMSADVTASIANDAARLPAGSAIVVDDFHTAAARGWSEHDRSGGALAGRDVAAGAGQPRGSAAAAAPAAAIGWAVRAS